MRPKRILHPDGITFLPTSPSVDQPLALHSLVINEFLIRQCQEEGNKSLFVFLSQLNPCVWMLRKVGIEVRAAFHLCIVVINHFFQGSEASVMHVRRSEFDIAQ